LHKQRIPACDCLKQVQRLWSYDLMALYKSVYYYYYYYYYYY